MSLARRTPQLARTLATAAASSSSSPSPATSAESTPPPPTASSSSSAPTTPLLSPKQRAKEAAWGDMLTKVHQRRAQRYTADAFSSLGSTQNRSTVYQPHQTLHSPPSPPSVTTSHLIASGAHLGHSTQLTHRAALPSIYGTRTGLSYIDLRQTLPALRRAAEVIKGVVERDGIVVFVGSLKGTEKAVWENAKRLGENGFGVTKWLPGSISNSKEVFGWCEIPQNGTAATEGGKGGKRPTAMSFKPSLLVLLSPTLNQHALREATANEVPTIGICDTDVDPRCVTYAIPANDDSPRAVELIAGVLGMAGKDGLARKKERQVVEARRKAQRWSGEQAARRQGNDY